MAISMIMQLMIWLHSKLILEAHPGEEIPTSSLKRLRQEDEWLPLQNHRETQGRNSPHVLRSGSSSSERVSMPLTLRVSE